MGVGMDVGIGPNTSHVPIFTSSLFFQVNYAMFFQLPLILSANFTPSQSNIISSLYSVGMMPGGIVCGYVSDLYGGRRACVIATFMAILCPLLLLFAWYMDTLPVSALLTLLCVMGCLVGGPNNIITSAVAADLADDPSIRGNNRALGTVTGIINGSGSVTAAFGQMAIPILAQMGATDGVGYRYVWYFLIESAASNGKATPNSNSHNLRKVGKHMCLRAFCKLLCLTRQD
ncbi:MFS transporter [archaeon]|nr:MAG: MFS transporter [archaeon]